MDTSEISLPGKPNSFGGKYVFPENLTTLASPQIGEWMSRLAAYRGYVVSLLAITELRRAGLKAEFDLSLAEECRRIDSGQTTQKAVREQAILAPRIREIGDKMVSSEKSCTFYSTVREIYQGQIDVLSREISRRQMAGDRE